MNTSIWNKVIQAHSALAPEVRDVDWVSNCGREIHIENTTGESLRIGHFQGDAKLSEFAVAAHQATLRASRETALHDQGSQLFRGRTPEAAAVQLGTVLAWLTEQQLESLEQLERAVRTPKSALVRQRAICDTAVNQCAELGVTPLGLAEARCTRLAARLAAWPGPQ